MDSLVSSELVQQVNHWLAAGGLVDALSALVAAFVFGQVLGWTYEFTFRGLSYSRGFSHAIVLVCVSAAILVLAMQHSLLAGLGLFGVLSMIRFRTDLKTPRDLVFVMGAACVGVAAGVGAIATGALGAAIFCLVAAYLELGPFGSRVRYDGVLRLRLPATAAAGAELERILGRHCARQALLSVSESNGAREHVYQVKLLRERSREALLGALRDELEAEDARLLLQDAVSEY
jgi:hypothetical protein